MSNNIGSEGIKNLASLGKDLTISSLRLNGNKIGPMVVLITKAYFFFFNDSPLIMIK